MNIHTWYFEDFEAGQRFVTQYRTITEADIATFAGWSWDTNPVHTDALTSGKGRFGGRIAHGMLGASVAMGLLSTLGIFEQCSIALLGIDEWRFEGPIRAGDSVRCEVEILQARLTSRGDAGILTRRLVLSNHDGDIVQQGMINLMVSRRP